MIFEFFGDTAYKDYFLNANVEFEFINKDKWINHCNKLIDNRNFIKKESLESGLNTDDLIHSLEMCRYSNSTEGTVILTKTSKIRMDRLFIPIAQDLKNNNNSPQ